MSIVQRNILKSFFATGKKPNQLQFYALLDSYVHVLDDRDLLGLKPYNELLVYKVGDTVVRNKTIYQASIQTSGVFDPAAWVKIAGTTEGGLFFKGAWDASTNQPALNDPTYPKTEGDYYVVSVAGNTNLDGITDWNVGDWAIYNGTVWQKIDNTDGVTDAQNLGNDGFGVFKEKDGTILGFRKLSADNGSVTITPDANDEHLDIAIKFDDNVTAINRVWSSQKTSDELDTKIDVPAAFVQNNLPAFDAAGQLIDSGYDPTDFLPSSTDAADIPITVIPGMTATDVQAALSELYSTKMPKITGVANNFPYFDGSGLIYNSGYNFNSFLPSSTQAVNIPVSPSGNVNGNVQSSLVAIDGISTTTQSGLSTHIANLSNPHQVTKAQVGLGNVTNDKQLSSKFYVEQAEATSNSTTSVDLYTIPINNLAAGDYFIDWYYEYTATATSIVIDAQVKDGATVLGHTELKIRSSDDFDAVSGFCKVSMGAPGTKTITFAVFRANGGGGGSLMTFRKFRIRLMSI